MNAADFEEKIDAFAALLTAAPRIAFLTGAGISTESGIPDFRSSTGIYRTTSAEMFDVENFRRDPDGFYRFFAPFYRETTAAKPNAGHLAISDLANRCGKTISVVTQNIDGLHSAAGSANVAEIHGTLRTATCLNCEKRFEQTFYDATVANGSVPKCAFCGGVLKLDVVFFGEPLPERELAAARRAMWEARLLVVLGTSLQVFPAAGLPRDCDSDVPFVVVNKTPTPLDRTSRLVFYDSIGNVLPKAVERVPSATR